jgi:NAD(P)-dependent dehydrogenase (short-subunit alcohol dehydrogenase family)
MPELVNQCILITGAGRGIGRALARACAQRQATVLLLSKTTALLESLSDEITASGQPAPLLIPFDFKGATPKDYHLLAQEIGATCGKLHALVHLAAIQGSKTPLSQYDILKWYETLHINLHAPFLLTRSLIPLLKRSPSANIIFTTAPAGHAGQAYQGAYGISKAGILNLMQMWAQELELHSNIQINAINPVAAATQLYQQNYPGPHPDIPKPEDITDLYLTLLSNPNHPYHGRCLHFNPSIPEGYTVCQTPALS